METQFVRATEEDKSLLAAQILENRERTAGATCTCDNTYSGNSCSCSCGRCGNCSCGIVDINNPMQEIWL